MHYLPDDGALDIAKAEVFLQKIKGYSIEEKLSENLDLSKADLEEAKTKIFYMERKNDA